MLGSGCPIALPSNLVQYTTAFYMLCGVFGRDPNFFLLSTSGFITLNKCFADKTCIALSLETSFTLSIRSMIES